jgi:serine/threonine protein kinase
MVVAINNKHEGSIFISLKIDMQDSVVNSISAVFHLTKEEAIEFLNVMATDNEVFPSESYMKDILNRLPKPKYYENRSKPVEENELNLNRNNRASGQGEFGYVHRNRSRPYAYKYFMTPFSLNSTNKWIQGQLTEPLINILLQNDPVIGDSICKLYQIFCEQTERGFSLIFKMESLGPTLMLLDRFLLNSTDLELNKHILLKIYGPVYKTLQYLRSTYAFEHGDLHSKNLLFRKNPLKKDGTLKESRLTVKLIDFGMSGLVYNEKLYGYNEAIPLSIKAEVRHFFFYSQLPDAFSEKIKSFGKKYLEIETYVIEEATAAKLMNGGRNKTRKHLR